MSKKRIGTVWLAGCSGCHMSLLDIDERILDVAKLADIVKSPIVDGKEFPDVDVALVEGAVASDEHLHEIQLIRQKAKVLVSFGDCAVTGNVAAMRNAVTKEAALTRAYVEAESNDTEGQVPDSPEIQKLLDRVRPLHEVVKVDYYIPGCPPSADLIFYVLFELLNDRIPDLEQGRKLKYG
ncbi:MAG: NADP oxidoreductase [Candidatus Omnitrophota bacterium]|nr:NADP oxidoreductase [Candidatus Omnitrophota bacterium]MDZ4241412.1 NADP oxidoreductase [Candidatus Omnitrophota bacterium]